MCSQCQKGSDFIKGVRLIGQARRLFKPAKDMDALTAIYLKFEKSRADKTKELIKREVSLDPFCKFIVEKTDVCPHKLITPLSQYLCETMFILDGDMGITLPGNMDSLPGIFFDSLGIVRAAKQLAQKEDSERTER